MLLGHVIVAVLVKVVWSCNRSGFSESSVFTQAISVVSGLHVIVVFLDHVIVAVLVKIVLFPELK